MTITEESYKWDKTQGIAPGAVLTKADHTDNVLRAQGVEVKYIVLQTMFPFKPGTLNRHISRRWEFVDTLDEARKLLSRYPDESEVWRVHAEQVKVDAAYHHDNVCNFRWFEGKQSCNCGELPWADKS